MNQLHRTDSCAAGKTRRRIVAGAATAVLAVLLLGCSGEKAEQDAAPTPTESVQATATESAKSAQAAGPDCSKLKPVTAPADEVMLGLTFGMSFEEAQQRLLCAKPGYTFKAGQSSNANLPDAPDAFYVRIEAQHDADFGKGNGGVDDDITMWFAVAADKTSKLIKLDRFARYSGAQRPSYPKFRADVEAKYPGIIFDDKGSTFHAATYVKSRDGQRLTKDNRLFSECIGTGAWQHSINMNPLCGVSFGIQIHPDQDGGAFVDLAQFALTKPGYAATALKEVSAINGPILAAQRKNAAESAPAPEL